MTIDLSKTTDPVSEKVLAYGAASLSDVELLSLFLTGPGKQTAIDRARDVLDVCDGLIQLVEDRQSQLSGIDGLTPKRLAMLFGAREFARRVVFSQCGDRDVMSSPEVVREYLGLHLTGIGHEVFSALFLDNRHRIIEYRELFRGSLSSAAVYPREILKRCLSLNAAAILVCHNHPSGAADPSDLDVRLIRKLVDALSLIDVRVVDHIIIGHGVHTSLAERGLM